MESTPDFSPSSSTVSAILINVSPKRPIGTTILKECPLSARWVSPRESGPWPTACRCAEHCIDQAMWSGSPPRLPERTPPGITAPSAPLSPANCKDIRLFLSLHPPHSSASLCRLPYLVQNRLDLLGQRRVAVTGGELIRLLRQGQALPRAAHLPEHQ